MKARKDCCKFGQ